MPCQGTSDRLLIIDELLNDIACILDDHARCTFLIGGDFNCDLDRDSDASALINSFIGDYCLKRCDQLFNCPSATYVNTALNCSSQIDYFLSSSISSLLSFNVVDDGSNISDHLNLIVLVLTL